MPSSTSQPSEDEVILPDVEDLTFDHPKNDTILRPIPPFRETPKPKPKRTSYYGSESPPPPPPPAVGRTVFPFRKSILANAIEVFDDMFSHPTSTSRKKEKVIDIAETDPDTLRLFLLLLSPSQTHPMSRTFSQLQFPDYLPLFRLAHKWDVGWILAEMEHRLVTLTRPNVGGSYSSVSSSLDDLYALFEEAFFMRPEPMYHLAAKTMSRFPASFALAKLPARLRVRLMKEAPDFYIAAEDFYTNASDLGGREDQYGRVTKRAKTAESLAAEGGWNFTNGIKPEHVKRLLASAGLKRLMDSGTWERNPGAIFAEVDLDCSEMLYWKGY
jgi:hypothetical protein